MRTVNTKFFVFLVASLLLSAGVIFGLHRLQAGNIADALLRQAEQAEKDGKLDRAARYLARYLEFARDDLDRREQLAMIQSDPKLTTTPQRRARARFVIEQVLAKDPNRHVLRHRLCELLIAGRKFESAKEHLVWLEKNQPTCSEQPYLTGRWHEAQSQLMPAATSYREAIRRDPGKIDAYMRLVPVLKQLDFGKTPRHGEEIAKHISAMLEKAPHDAVVLAFAAQEAQERGEGAVALRFLEDGLKRHPAEPRLYLTLASIQAQTGKRGEAIDRLKDGLKKVSKEQQYDLRWSLGNLLLDDSRLEDAAKVIAEMRDINPVSADYLQARLHMQRGRWFDAVRQFEKIRPSLRTTKELAVQIDLYLGLCYESLEETVLQLGAFQRAAETDPTSVAAQRGVAKARWTLGQTQEALRGYADLAAKTKDPRDAAHRRLEYVRLLMQRGSKLNAKEISQIDEELTKVEKTLSKSIEVALVRAELAQVRGDSASAEKLLQDVVRDFPDRHEPWMALIAMATEKKDATLTRQLLESAEAKFKNKAEFRLAQVRYWSHHNDAEAIAGMKRLEDGIAQFTPAEQSGLLQALAETHYFASRHADSLRVMRSMLRLPMHADDVRVRMQMLEVAIAQHDDAQAQTILAEVKRIDGESADWSFGEALRIVRLTRTLGRETMDRARHLLTVAAAQRPNWAPVVQARAELDELQGRNDQAIANYRRAIELGSRDPLATKHLLVLLSQAHRYEEVDQLLLNMQKQFGATDEVVRYYVASSVQRRDYRKAEYLIKRIVAEKSKNYRDHLWMGQILAAGGQANTEAETAFRRSVALAPQESEAWFNLIRFLIGSGRSQEARTEMDNARKALPADRQDLVLAQASELLGQNQDALTYYREAITKQPSAVTHRAAADFTMRVGRWTDAEGLYRKLAEQKIIVREDEAKAARQGLTLALVRQNRPEKTAEALKLAGFQLDANGMPRDGASADSREEQLLQARVLGLMANHKLRERSIGMLESLRTKAPLADDDQYLLARLYIQQGPASAHSTKSKILLRAITNNQPKNVRYLILAGRELLEQREFGDAEPIIGRLEQVERERGVVAGGFGSIELRAKLLELRGQGTQAAALLSAYAEQPEASPVRWLLVAHLYGRLGQYREAIDLCEKVRKTEALAAEANAAAVGVLRTNKPSEAQPTNYQNWRREFDRVEVYLREAIAKNTKEASLRLFLADMMELQGRYDEVERLCREVLREQETNLIALNNLAWLLGQRREAPAEALALIERAIDKYGPRPELLDTRAIVLLNLGRAEDALKDMQRVVDEAPTATRLFHLTRVHAKLKNATVAVAMLRQANEMGLTAQQLHPVEQAEYHRVSAELGRR